MKERIKETRKMAGLSQTAFGARIGLTGGAISLIELGKRTPQESTLRMICQTYGVSFAWLTTGEGAMMDAPKADAHGAVDRLLTVMQQMPDHVWAAFRDAARALLDAADEARAQS